MGAGNEVFENAVIGGKPQHLQAGASGGSLTIGARNMIRENVTIHRGLAPDTETRIGDHNMLMVNAHVAHDCVLGNHVILVNNCMLAGHVLIGDRAYIAGAAGIHQFCQIGQLAMMAKLGTSSSYSGSKVLSSTVVTNTGPAVVKRQHAGSWRYAHSIPSTTTAVRTSSSLLVEQCTSAVTMTVAPARTGKHSNSSGNSRIVVTFAHQTSLYLPNHKWRW